MPNLYLLGFVCERQIDSDDVTLLDEVIHLSEFATQLLLPVLIQVFVIKVQHLCTVKWLHVPQQVSRQQHSLSNKAYGVLGWASNQVCSAA